LENFVYIEKKLTEYMQVKITAFGITRDIVGASSLELELPNGASVSDLRQALGTKYPKLANLTSLAIAVNQEYAQNDIQLTENDEVVLIPPVSGG